jgi:hypothetical protein
MGFLTKTTTYTSEDHDGIIHVEGWRWFAGGRLRNLCFYDGTMWHQADRETMDDIDRAEEWVKGMHERVLSS